MCGICGVVYKDTGKTVTTEWLRKLAGTLTHRGPDDEGIVVMKNVGMAHRRLSIIDLSGGHQPMFNEDEAMAIVFNGEIYNHESVREDLLKRGHRYSSKSDTETILHAYEEYGEACVRHLRGMFAFAIYDKRKDCLFIARDRVGKKPLYYYQNDDVFIFASEIKAIFASGMARKEINAGMLDFYMSLGYVPGRETLFKNIFKLEPGQYAVLDRKFNLTRAEYWDIRGIEKKDISYSDACSQLTDKLTESVRIRLMSEVPLGVFLSGGLDSSAIVACMSRLVSQPIKTFSVGYKDAPQTSELGYARIVADRLKTEHHEFYLTPDGLFDSIELFLEHSEEPIVESAGIALLKLAQLAKPYATVLLSGEGADEIMAGYPIYPRMKQLELLHMAQRMVPGSVLDRFNDYDRYSEQVQKYVGWMRKPFAQRYRSLSYSVSDSIRRKMYSGSFRDALSGSFEQYFSDLHNRVAGKSMLGKMLYIDTKSWLAEDILLKADRMTMAASIELRAPFLDHELMEFCYSLPDSYKLKGSKGKFILKEIMKDYLPAEIIWRRKKGFPVPLTSWFGGELQQRTKDLLLSKKSTERGYFESGYVQGVFDRINRGEDMGKRIFALLTLELWHRKYID